MLSLFGFVRRKSRAFSAVWAMFLVTAVLMSAPAAHATQSVVQRAPVMSTVAGETNNSGYSGDGMLALTAKLDSPEGLAVDKAGNVFIADYDNSLIRRVDAATGIITTVAGVPHNNGYNGDNIAATTAQLNYPAGVAVDAAGNLFIADSSNSRIRRVDAMTGIITTVAGTGSSGYSGNNMAATTAQLNDPYGIAVDAAGNLFIADTGNSYVREVVASTGSIVTLTGTGSRAFSNDGGQATAAAVNQPCGLAVDAAGNLYIADTYNHRVRMIAATTNATTGTTAGDIYTVAGTGTAGYNGDSQSATTAQLNNPESLTIDASGNLYIADQDNYRVRMVAAGTNVITTIAGTGSFGTTGDGGLAASAKLGEPSGVAFDGKGNLYIVDYGQNVIRKVLATTGNIPFPATSVGSTSALVSIPLVAVNGQTWTGVSVPSSQGGVQEYTVTADSCALNTPLAAGTICNLTIAFSPGYPGVRSVPLIVTTTNQTFRFGLRGVGLGPQIGFTPALITTSVGFYPGNTGFAGNNAAATTALLHSPLASVSDYAGNLYIADALNWVIRRVDAQTGVLTTISGIHGQPGATGDGGPATSAKINYGRRLTLDGAGNLYFADQGNEAVRKIDATTGTISTVAGTLASAGQSGDGGLATSAQLYVPKGLSFDAAGNLYIVDNGNNAIRRVDAASGIITTVAGILNGTGGYSGDGGLATAAQLNSPSDVKLDSAENLYISDETNNVVRKVTVSTGIITTAVGMQGTGGYSGDGGLATASLLSDPEGLTFDADNNLYIADAGNGVIRRVDAATGFISTSVGTSPGFGYSGDGGPANAAVLGGPDSPSFDSTGQLYISDSVDNVVRKVSGAASLSFTSTYVGAAAAAQDVTITNNGNAALTFSALTLPADFNLSGADSTCAATTSLAPGASCVLGVVFHPASVGVKSENLTLVDNQGTQTVPVSGTGLTVTATTTTLTASSQNSLYGQAVTLTATIAPAPTGSPLGTVCFYSGTTLLGTGTPNGSGIDTLATSGLLDGTDSVTAVYSGNTAFTTSTSAAVPVSVTLPLAAISGTAPAAQFPATAVGATSAALTLTFTITTASTSITSVTVPASQGGVQEYAITGNSCALNMPLAAGTVCTVTVVFTPGYPGVRGIPLIVATSAGTFRYGLSGMAIGPRIGFSPALITTVAGHQPGSAGFAGDGGPATGALLNTPFNAAFDYAGNLYFPDIQNYVIRRIDAVTGVITTFAGTPHQSGSTGDGGLATNAKITFTGGPALDSAGNLYFVDIANHVVRKVDATTGFISTVVGTLSTPGHAGDGGPGLSALLSVPEEITFDPAGNMYISEGGNSDVRRIDAVTGIITKVAGAPDYASGYSGDGGPATNAHLSNPLGVQFDSAGNMYIDDDTNNVVRRVDAVTGIISSPIGTYTLSGGFSGNGGPGSAAYLNDPQGFFIDVANNLYLSDASNNDIRKVNGATGIISTVAGMGNPNVSGYTGDGGPATAALLNYPAYPKLDNAGNLYIADSGNNVVRKVSGAASLSFTSTYVGAAAAPQDVTITNNGNGALVLTALTLPVDFNLSGADTTCTATTSLAPAASCVLGVVFHPASVGLKSESLTLVDNQGTQTVPVSGTGLAVTVTATTLTASAQNSLYGQQVTLTATIAPAPTGSPLGTVSFYSGTTLLGTSTPNGSGVATLATPALLDGTDSVTAVYSGTLAYTASTSPAVGITITLPLAAIGGTAPAAQFPATSVGATSAPVTLTFTVSSDSSTNITGITVPVSQGGVPEYTVTGNSCALNTPFAANTVCTITVTFSPSYPGVRAIPLIVATSTGTFRYGLRGVGQGPQIGFTPALITTAAGFFPGTRGFSGDGGPATAALLALPEWTTSDYVGNLYVADLFNSVIRRVDALTGTITTFAGTPGQQGSTGDGGPATSAKINVGNGLAFDTRGNLYFADQGNQVVRKIDAATGIISTVAGTLNSSGQTGDGGPATSARFHNPTSVAFDSAGNMYIADPANNGVRRVDAVTGTITTFAGLTNRSAGYSGDGGPATSAQLHTPDVLAIDAQDNLYITDRSNNVVRKVTASTGTISTVIGVQGAGAFSGDGGPANAAHLDFPSGITVDAGSNLYVTDASNSVIRRVNASTGVITSFAGVGDPNNSGYTGDGGAATSALLNYPQPTSLDSRGNLYITDSDNNVVREVGGSVPLSFAPAFIGASTAAQDVTITNNGNAALTFSALTLPADFNLTGANTTCTATTSLAPGASCVLSVKMRPTVAGALSEILTLVDNQGTQTVPVSGTGLALAPTATTLAASTLAPTFGQPVTLTATVAPIPTGTPLGAVNFYSGSTLLGTGTVNSSGIATLTTMALPGGTDAITAVYSGTSAGFAASTSAAVNIAVAPLATVTTFAASSTNLIFGQSTTLTATVAPTPTGSPLGTVSFFSGTTLLGTSTVNSEGIATSTTTALPIGTDAVTAIYSGNGSFATSTSAAMSFTVASPVVTLTASIAPASPVYGQPTSLLVSDTAGGVAVAGSTITAVVGGQSFTCTTNASGQCTIALAGGTLQGGGNTVTVTSSSTATALAGSATLPVTVQPATPTVAAVITPNVLTYGQPATVNVTETTGTLPIAGATATLMLGGHAFTCLTNAQGVCSITLPGGVLPGGTTALSVATSATSNAGAGGGSSSAMVTAAATSVTATISPLHPTYGEAATVTITATTSTPNQTSLPVAGALETVTIAGHSYTCTTTAAGQCQILLPAGALTGGNDRLAIVNAATANTAASTGSLSVTVGPAPTMLTLGSSSIQFTVGDPVTLTATVSALVAGTPTGIVTFYANSNAIGTGTVTGRVASLTLSTLAVGANGISANYGGDPSFLPSSASGFTQTGLVDFTLTITGGGPGVTPTQTIPPGGTAVYPLSLGIINGFVGPVTLSANGLPAGATATFNPAVVTLDGIHPGLTTLSITTTSTVGRAAQPKLGKPESSRLAYGLLLLPLFYLRRLRRNLSRLQRPGLLGPVAVLTLAGLSICLSGCGSGGYFGSGPKNYAVTVTATSNALHHSTTVTLTVQ